MIDPSKHFIVTVSREIGSGGRTIGRKLAEKLSVRYSDKELIKALEDKFNLTTYGVEKLKGEKKDWLADFLHWLAPVPRTGITTDMEHRYMLDWRGDVTSEDIFVAESEILKGIAQADSCVIAGRSGFFVLKDFPNKVDIFITAPREDRIARIASKQNINPEEAARIVDSVDQSRENYIKRYTGVSRYDARNYDLVLNVGGMTTDTAADLIYDFITRK